MRSFIITCLLIISIISMTSFELERPNLQKRFSYTDTTRCSDDRPIPSMYVDDSICRRRIKWFENHQLRKYNNMIHKQDTKSILCDASDFVSFLNNRIKDGMSSLSIFIASYPTSDREITIPNTHTRRLTVFFASDYKGIPKDVYVLDPNNNYKITPHTWPQSWIDEYEAKRRSNIPDPREGDKYDTRSITFSEEVLQEFIEEINCQEASGVKIYFSSYRDKSKESKHADVKKHNYFKRLGIQFELVDNTGNEIILEKQKNYNQRRKASGKKIFGFNTGTLCPPCVNCPPGTPGCENPVKSQQPNK